MIDLLAYHRAGAEAFAAGAPSCAYIALRLPPAAREAWRRGWGAACRAAWEARHG